jgi:SAM-dependent methyltransferase
VSENAAEFWERRYAGQDRIWSGRPNHWLEVVAAPLAPGRVLDLGCGEGGDAVWLAAHGWEVTAVDVSETAVRRTTELAASAGVAGRVHAERRDLEEALPDGDWDLVNAQFLQTPLPFDRPRVLRQAASAVRPGGRLLVVDHGAAPPWSGHHDVYFPTAQETLTEIALDLRYWEVETAEGRSREATGPSGEVAMLLDNVLVFRRSTEARGTCVRQPLAASGFCTGQTPPG